MITTITRIFVWLLYTILMAVFSQEAVFAQCPGYSSYIKNGSYGVADKRGAILEGCNLDDQFVPASVVKIITALTALRVLGPDHHFVTDFFIDGENNLFIKGYGDPLLLSEEVEGICSHLKNKGISELNNILIDTTAYDLNGIPPGSSNSDRSYDAPVGATAVNFNSVSVHANSKGHVVSGERQTPTLPIMKELAKGLKSVRKRINICKGGCDPAAISARYTCELFSSFLHQEEVLVNGSCGTSMTPAEAELVFSYSNPRLLSETVQSMLYYSSNFIANQLYLNAGAAMFGYPATWNKGRMAAEQTLASMLSHEELEEVFLLEGAGLSRANRMTADSMLKILHAFRPYRYLLRNYYSTSSKTGTLDGVYNYAGYLSDNKAYVIFLNQSQNYRTRILRKLKKKYPATKK